MRSVSSLAYTALVLLAVLITVRAIAETSKSCTAAEARRARRELSQIGDWQSFYSSFKRFGQCDSGTTAEEYSYALSRLLAHDWENLDVLLHFTADDPKFKNFVLRHIDENIPEEEAQRIIQNSRQHCPSNGEWLCRSIVDY